MIRNIFTATVILTLLSCNKSSSNANYCQISIAGTEYTFDNISTVVDTTHNGVPITNMTAINTKTNSRLTLGIMSNSALITGTYSRAQPPPLINGFTVAEYLNSSTFIYDLNLGPFTITIDRADLTGTYYIHGSFSGTLYTQNEMKAVTVSGQFGSNFRYGIP